MYFRCHERSLIPPYTFTLVVTRCSLPSRKLIWQTPPCVLRVNVSTYHNFCPLLTQKPVWPLAGSLWDEYSLLCVYTCIFTTLIPISVFTHCSISIQQKYSSKSTTACRPRDQHLHNSPFSFAVLRIQHLPLLPNSSIQQSHSLPFSLPPPSSRMILHLLQCEVCILGSTRASEHKYLVLAAQISLSSFHPSHLFGRGCVSCDGEVVHAVAMLMVCWCCRLAFDVWGRCYAYA